MFTSSIITRVSNGFTVEQPWTEGDKNAPCGTFVFPTFPELMTWLADRYEISAVHPEWYE